MKKYDLTAIMRKAWSLRKAAAAEMGCKVSEVIMSECLRDAWKAAKAAEANKPAAVREAWDKQTGEEQDTFLRKMIHKAADDAIARTVSTNRTTENPTATPAPGYAGYNEGVAWSWNNKDLPDMVSEAYIFLRARLDRLDKTDEARAAKGKPPMTLVAVVYNAARDAISKVYRDDIKHGRAATRTIKDAEGVERSYIEEMVRDPAQSTEAAALASVTLERFTARLDDVDRAIVACTREGYTLKQTAEYISRTVKQISYVAVHKRLDKMRETLRAEIA